MQGQRIIIAVLIIILVIAGGYFLFGGRQETLPEPTMSPDTKPSIMSFEECAAKYPVLESHPRQCNTPDGKHFVEDIGNEPGKADLIRVASPRPDDVITSPLAIKGEAWGVWFFEGSFPVRLLDEDGNEIASAVAQAQDEWMTENFVPFRTTLQFVSPAIKKGTLVFEKDNPSGLPEYSDELRIPVLFK